MFPLKLLLDKYLQKIPQDKHLRNLCSFKFWFQENQFMLNYFQIMHAYNSCKLARSLIFEGIGSMREFQSNRLYETDDIQQNFYKRISEYLIKLF